MRFKVGIGGKIIGGFALLGAIAVIIGGAGYKSLDIVTDSGDLNSLAKSTEIKLLDARRYEKNYLMRKDKESYNNLATTLTELGRLAEALKLRAGQGGNGDEILKAKAVYSDAALELQRLTETDDKLIEELGAVAKDILKEANQETEKAAAQTMAEIVEQNSKSLRDSAMTRSRNVVEMAWDVLRYHHDGSLGKDVALNVIRNLHFDENNYIYVVGEDLVLVAHGADRKLEGMDFGKIQDKKTGRTFMKEVVASALQQGGAYTEYYWTKPGMGDAIYPKVTYAKYYKPWGLVVCAGVYMDDFENEVAKTNSVIQAGLKRLQQANSINDLAMAARTDAVQYLISGQDTREQVKNSLSELKGLSVATDDLKQKADVYRDKFFQTVANGEAKKAQVAKIVDVARAGLKVADGIEKSATEAYLSTSKFGKSVILSFLVIGLLGCGAVATLLSRAIIRPIRRAIEGLDASSVKVTTASALVSDGSHELAEGTSQQAAAIEETSSSLEEMSSMTRRNAESARQANGLMSETRQVVTQADVSMQKLTESMRQVSQASEETFKIIKTIDEIAFQTNLLALNAAVEAARAGEAGAGFAVVADEVRNLAMRAAEAARNTAQLIEGTVKKIREGSDLVEATSREFTQVTQSSSNAGDLVGEIVAASEEQAQGIAQISKAVAEMDKVVQRNAASAQESSSASEVMNAQAETMKEFVSDLVALIGKAEGNNATHTLPAFREVERIASVLPVERGRKIAPEAPRAPVQGREMRPSQIIPFDEEDF